MKATRQRLLQVAAPSAAGHHARPFARAQRHSALHVGKQLGIPVVYEIRAFWEDAAVDHGTTQEGSLRYRHPGAGDLGPAPGVDHAFTICEGCAPTSWRAAFRQPRSLSSRMRSIEGFQLSAQPMPPCANGSG
jgi:glycogen(starch) synthase